MKYDAQRHHRRSTRLAGYDYSQPGAYFVTICTYNRELFLEVEQVKQIVRSAWDGLPARFPHVMLDEFVMMPNHIHGIIVFWPFAGVSLGSGEGAASSAPTNGPGSGDREVAASSAPTLGQVVRAFKSLSAIESNRSTNKPERQFWQRNYYDHIVRDEDEMNVIRQYIRDNPARWDQDPDNPAN